MFLSRVCNRFLRTKIQACFSLSRYFTEGKPPESEGSKSLILPFEPKLPIDEEIELIVNRQAIYVDKTEMIYDLLDDLPNFIITRPRRFGKSLLLSTIAAIAQKKALLANLAIGSRLKQLQEHPVLEFNFSYDGSLEGFIDKTLQDYAEYYGIKFTPGDFQYELAKVIKQIYTKLGPLYILVDEFDHPTYNQDETTAKNNLRVLQAFLNCLKKCQRFTKHQVITGITTPEYLELGSGANHLRVLTFEEPYAALLGFTENEIKKNFGHYLKLLEAKWSCNEAEVWGMLRENYNGYSFSKTANKLVYNPYSIVECLRTQELDAHWTKTASTEKLQQTYEKFAASKRLRNKFSVSNQVEDLQWKLPNPDINLALWNFGYLTIESFSNGIYYLKPPNLETKNTIENLQVEVLRNSKDSQIGLIRRDIVQSLLSENIREFTENICIYYYLQPQQNVMQNEAEFESSLVSLFSGFQDAGNFSINQQKKTGDGRYDVVIQSNEAAFIIELKYNKSSKEAYSQILERDYGKEISRYIKRKYLIGINYNEDLRTIDTLSFELRSRTENTKEHYKVTINKKKLIPEAEITLE